MLKTSEVLDTAADLIEKRGWTQGQLYNDEGEMCTIGALREAMVGLSGEWTLQGEFQVTDALRSVAVMVARSGVAHWNDEHGRTKQQVLDTLRKAAKVSRLDEEGIT